MQACVPAETTKSATTTTISDTSSAQPRSATYNCGDHGRLTVETSGSTSIHLTEPDGTVVDLPASPPSQHSRFGNPPYALVIEGNEALLMKNGKVPMTCTR